MSKTLKALGLLLMTGAVMLSCNSTIDDGDGPPVVLEVTTFDFSQPAMATSSGGGAGSTCVLDPPQWTITFTNLPKNADAITSPFNDIVLETVDVTYVDATPPLGVAGGSFPIGDITVPVNGSASLIFTPINPAILNPGGAAVATNGGGVTVNLVFRGQLIEGTSISRSLGAVLIYDPCPVTN